MLFSDYLMIKTGGEGIKTYRSVVYFLITIGCVFFTTDLLEIIMTVGNPKWFLIIPIRLRYILTASAGPVLTTIRSCADLFRSSLKHML